MTRKRAIWMDVVRGLAIIAVIYGHVENVAKIEAVFEREDWMVTTNMTLVLLRMPMLMFLSGMLVPRSIAKGWKMFLPGKFTKLAWPYAVWIAIFFTVVWIRGGAELSQIPMEIINPGNPNMTPLWYLRNLFFYYLIAQALTWLRLPLWSGAALGFGICVYQVIDNPQIGTTPLRWGYLMTFFFLGCLTMQHLDKISRFCRKPVVTLLLAVAFVIPVYIYLQGIAPVRYRPEFIWGTDRLYLPDSRLCTAIEIIAVHKATAVYRPLFALLLRHALPDFPGLRLVDRTARRDRNSPLSGDDGNRAHYPHSHGLRMPEGPGPTLSNSLTGSVGISRLAATRRGALDRPAPWCPRCGARRSSSSTPTW